MSTIILRPTESSDIGFVTTAEQHADNRRLIAAWSHAEHERALTNDDLFHGIVMRTSDAAAVGFVLLAGRHNPHGSVELRRIVITEKGQGYGTQALRLVKALAFNLWHAHRLWLDVLPQNIRAQQLYAAEGFSVEGTLRECMRTADGYASLVLMAMLEHEYEDA